MLKLAAIVAFASGCSIALQSKPSPGVARSASRCSTTHAYWIADAVGVAVGAAAMVFAVVERGKPEAFAGGPGALGSVLYLASAGNGYRWRRECAADAPAPIASR